MALRDRLAANLDRNDELLVVLSSGVGAWTGFEETVSNWLKTNCDEARDFQSTFGTGPSFGV